MKLIEAYHVIETEITGKELKMVEKAARNCYKSEDKITEDGGSARRITKTLLINGHESPIEFTDIVVRFICDRAISHELVRHRLCSFAQESQRYCNYSNGKFNAEVTFIRPWWLHEDDEGYSEFVKACQDAEDKYFELLSLGWHPEQARGVLPNATKTDILVKANLREWRHILKERTDLGAHVDMRHLMTGVLEEFQQLIPGVFDDIPVRR